MQSRIKIILLLIISTQASFSQNKLGIVSLSEFLSKSIFLNQSLKSSSNVIDNQVFYSSTEQLPPIILPDDICIEYIEELKNTFEDSAVYWMIQLSCVAISVRDTQAHRWIEKRIPLSKPSIFVVAVEKGQYKCVFGDCLKVDLNAFFDRKDEYNYEKIVLLFGSFLSIDSVVEISNDDTSVIFAARSRDKHLYIIGIDKSDLNNIFYCDDPRFRDIKIHPVSIRQTDRNRINEIHKMYYNSSNSSKMPFRFVGTTKHF